MQAGLSKGSSGWALQQYWHFMCLKGIWSMCPGRPGRKTSRRSPGQACALPSSHLTCLLLPCHQNTKPKQSRPNLSSQWKIQSHPDMEEDRVIWTSWHRLWIYHEPETLNLKLSRSKTYIWRTIKFIPVTRTKHKECIYKI